MHMNGRGHMKKIAITIFLITILFGNVATAEQLATFDNPQIYVSPPTFVQLESSTFNASEIDFSKVCVDPNKSIPVTDVNKVTDAFDNYKKYLVLGGKYYELCFVFKDFQGFLLDPVKELIKFEKKVDLPIIISGLEFSGDLAGLVVSSDAYVVLHNITIDKSKQGIELNCRNGCMLANSKLTGVTATPPEFSTGIKMPALSSNITIINTAITAFDIGIDVYSKKSLVERCEVIGNKMYGLFVHEDANLSIKSMKSMIGNGDGKSALNAFTPNSNIGLIKAIQAKETFVVPESAIGNIAARYVEFYRPDTSKNIQPFEFLHRYDLKSTDLAQKGDSLTITAPAIRGQYLIAMFTGGDGSTLSIDTFLAKDRVIITSTDTMPIPASTGEEMAGGGADGNTEGGSSNLPSSPIDGMGSGMSMAAACSLNTMSEWNINSSLQCLWLLGLVVTLIFRKKSTDLS